MRKVNIWFVGVIFLLSACTETTATPAPTSISSWIETSPPPSKTVTALWTDTPAATFTPSPIPRPTWVLQGPGDLTIPILLYHHIGISPIDSRYYVPPEKFEQEIKVLHDLNYTSITVKML